MVVGEAHTGKPRRKVYIVFVRDEKEDPNDSDWAEFVFD